MSLEEEKEKEDQHHHGPKCGHLAIVHVNTTGDVHVGFVSENGDLNCFSPPPTDVDAPKGSLFNICLESETGQLGLHKRGNACRSKRKGCC